MTMYLQKRFTYQYSLFWLFNEVLRVPLHGLTFVNLVSTSAPSPAHCLSTVCPFPQLLICSRHNNLNGEVKHSLSFFVVVTFFSCTVKILQFTHHCHKTSKTLFLTLSVLLLLYMVILKLNWFWRNKRKV